MSLCGCGCGQVVTGWNYNKKQPQEYIKGHHNRGIIPKSAFRHGANSILWKGGRYVDSTGYVRVYKPNHPSCNSRGYIFEHRILMEESLCRLLDESEVVHHINKIKSDNRLENLQLIETNSKHISLEFKGRKSPLKGKKLSEEVRKRLSEVAKLRVKRLGYCIKSRVK